MNINHEDYTKSIKEGVSRLVRGHEVLISNLVSKAIETTAAASLAKDSLRKSYLTSLTDQMARDMATRRLIASQVANLTHERGPWPMVAKQQTSWKLDEIEGNQRMRLRLCRSFKSLDEKFYRENSEVPKSTSHPVRFSLNLNFACFLIC